MMNYEQAIEYMKNVQKKGSVLGLEPVKILLEQLDNPQEKLKVIHVAGTNGKGSICTFLEAMYRGEGKKIGRYISPTIHCYLERFQINGVYMEEAVFAKLLTQVEEVIKQMDTEGKELPTAFEIETVIAFLYFWKEKVDLVILETGMGGREDATNVVSKPICTVFSSIGMDHMQFLGDTLEQIAFEKAGIMKEGCPAVVYPNSSEVMEVLKKQGSLHNVVIDEVNKDQIRILSETLNESIFYYNGIKYQIRMLGEYQIYNAVTAIETKLFLDGYLIKESLMEAKWEGRFEKISESPLFIRDGAHNTDGAGALKESIEKHFTNRKIIYIIGVLEDKEYDKMVELLCPMAVSVFTVTPENGRALPGSVLREHVLPYCKDVMVCTSVENAVKEAKQEYEMWEKKGQKPVIVAWGSLSYIGQING